MDNVGDIVTENANEGIDTVYSSISTTTLWGNVENLLLGIAAITGTGNDLDNQIVGNALNNTLTGYAGNDWLDGQGGTDVMVGGAGNDIFLSRGFYGAGNYTGDTGTDLLDFSQSDVYTAGRRSAEGAGVKVDLAASKAFTYYLSASNFTWTDANGQLTLATIENVRGTNQADSLSGDVNANVLEGGAGNDVLIGKGGNDTLIGGTGNDTYLVDNTVGYTLTEAANADIDTVQASVNYSLVGFTNIENLTLIGTATTGTGDAFDNVLTGNSVSNTLNAGAGNDTLDGGASDVYNPSVTDTLNGEAGNDTFLSRGFYGAGTYNGGVDIDWLDFSQSDAYTAGRRANEGAGVKVDLLAGKASTYYLRANNFTWADANGQIALTGIENVLGTTQSDLITGDANANVLDGGASDNYNPNVTDVLNGGGRQ